jgi:hypothetical protein
MPSRSSPYRLTAAAAVLAGAAALTMAMAPARADMAAQEQPPTVPDSAAQAIVDTATQLVIDTVQEVVTMEVAQPAPRTATAWPVDPVTGQTLINGKPVRGRVFVMHKVGVDAPYDIATRMDPEPLPPEPAIVSSSYTPAPAHVTRRHRGAMIQATEWLLDSKPAAKAGRYYHPVAAGR